MVFTAKKATVQAAKNQPEIAGSAMKATVQNKSNKKPESQRPARGLNICVMMNLFMC